jgi:LAO/AO transport system kinase
LNQDIDIDQLAKDVVTADRRALARAISLIEEGGKPARQLTSRLFVHSGKSHLIGITGSPGVGKSTLVDVLIGQIRKQGLSVAVLAIDPSSPFSGGAILGDRIRMQEHTLDEGVFIRSMANKGQSGGIAIATYDAVRMLEAAGYDIVIIETVGVGQSELAIALAADTTILVLMPGSGDDIQAIKSGIMEIGDIFVINKADLPGANKTKAEIVSALEMVPHTTDWRPKVIMANSVAGDGAQEIWQTLCAHKEFLSNSGLIKERRQAKFQAELSEIVAAKAKDRFIKAMSTSPHVQKLLSQVAERKLDTNSAAEEILSSLIGPHPDEK